MILCSVQEKNASGSEIINSWNSADLPPVKICQELPHLLPLTDKLGKCPIRKPGLWDSFWPFKALPLVSISDIHIQFTIQDQSSSKLPLKLQISSSRVKKVLFKNLHFIQYQAYPATPQIRSRWRRPKLKPDYKRKKPSISSMSQRTQSMKLLSALQNTMRIFLIHLHIKLYTEVI